MPLLETLGLTALKSVLPKLLGKLTGTGKTTMQRLAARRDVDAIGEMLRLGQRHPLLEQMLSAGGGLRPSGERVSARYVLEKSLEKGGKGSETIRQMLAAMGEPIVPEPELSFDYDEPSLPSLPAPAPAPVPTFVPESDSFAGDPMPYFFGYDDEPSNGGAAGPVGAAGPSGWEGLLQTGLTAALTGLVGGGNGQEDTRRYQPGEYAFETMESYYQQLPQDRLMRRAQRSFQPTRGPLGPGQLPISLPGVQPSGQVIEYDKKFRVPGWRWPMTYPTEAIIVLEHAMRLAVMDYVTEDELKRALRPLNWKMAHQMSHDIKTGGELRQFIAGRRYGADSSMDKERGMAILALVLQDLKPRRRPRRLVPKYVERFFDKVKGMKALVRTYYDREGKAKVPSKRRKRK